MRFKMDKWQHLLFVLTQHPILSSLSHTSGVYSHVQAWNRRSCGNGGAGGQVIRQFVEDESAYPSLGQNHESLRFTIETTSITLVS